MVLGRVTISFLNEIDKTVKGFVRQWLALPNDTPTADFHAPPAERGLGIPSLKLMALLQRRKRLIAMLSYHNIGEVEDGCLARKIILCTRRLTCKDGNVIGYLNKIEGKLLRESRRVLSQHGWVGKGTMLLSGRSFIWVKKLRRGGMPTNCRFQRGRRGERSCRAGCGVPESIIHVLQHCFITSDGKTAR